MEKDFRLKKSRSSHGHCPLSLLCFLFPGYVFFRNTPLFITSFFVTSSDPIIIITIIMTPNFMAHTHLKNRMAKSRVKTWKGPTRVPILSSLHWWSSHQKKLKSVITIYDCSWFSSHGHHIVRYRPLSGMDHPSESMVDWTFVNISERFDQSKLKKGTGWLLKCLEFPAGHFPVFID